MIEDPTEPTSPSHSLHNEQTLGQSTQSAAIHGNRQAARFRRALAAIASSDCWAKVAWARFTRPNRTSLAASCRSKLSRTLGQSRSFAAFRPGVASTVAAAPSGNRAGERGLVTFGAFDDNELVVKADGRVEWIALRTLAQRVYALHSRIAM